MKINRSREIGELSKPDRCKIAQAVGYLPVSEGTYSHLRLLLVDPYPEVRKYAVLSATHFRGSVWSAEVHHMLQEMATSDVERVVRAAASAQCLIF